MNPRIPKNTHADNNFEREFAEISSRVRKAFEALIPKDWEKATMVVREASPESDELLETQEPIWNPSTSDILETGDESELIQALEELYLVFFPTHRPWEACEVLLETLPSGKRSFRTRRHYPKKDNPGGDIPF